MSPIGVDSIGVGILQNDSFQQTGNSFVDWVVPVKPDYIKESVRQTKLYTLAKLLK